MSDVTPRVDVYTVIANHWDIPRHRVKCLFQAGVFGMAGSEKSVEQWIENLDAWDDAERVRLAATTKEALVAVAAAMPKRRGRFRGILGFKK